jgi:uncharacterized sulfatase
MPRLWIAAVLWGAASAPAPQDPPPPRPNILWITCEDMSPNLGCYGDPYAVTPNLDRLAAQGVRYTRAFAPSGVCAPARSSLILGMYASSVGTQHMRCRGTLSAEARCFPEYLRRAGYFCTNNVKTDYNFPVPRAAWDESSAKAHWRARPAGRPFFSVFNLTHTHESQVRQSEESYRRRTAEFSPLERHDPARAPLPPYHPDSPEVRRDWARYADMVTLMDREVGRLLRELEEDGRAEDTIVFFFSDHGAGLPRSKRWLYDSSLRVPLLVRFPEKFRSWAPAPPGGTCDRLVSFVDFGPTVLRLAGVPVPASLQGRPFLGPSAGSPREYVYGFRDRMDERTDLLRAVRDGRFKYIRNYLPHRPYAQHISYMYEMPTMKVWRRLHDEGKLSGPARAFFEPKPAEELYDTEADPWEVRNLAGDPAHRETLERLRGALRSWMLEIRDLGFLPEPDLRARFGETPPYEAVRRDPASYPLERLMEAAERASRRDVGEIPELTRLLADGDPAIRWWGATGLGALGPAAAPAREALRTALEDPAPWVRVAAADALAAQGAPDEALGVLERALEDSNEWVRLHAAEALDRMGEKARPALGALRRAAKDSNEYVRRVVDHALGVLR